MNAFKFFRRKRRHRIIRDEQGRTGKKQAFDLFDRGYRPSEIIRDDRVPLPPKTLYRYYEEWKKTRKSSASAIQEYLENDLELSPKHIGALAEYFAVPEDEIVKRMQSPLSLLGLLSREHRGTRLYAMRRKVEADIELGL